MDDTKDGAKGHQEQDVHDFGIPMLRYVERRDPSGVSRVGSWCPHCVSDSGKGEGEKCRDRRHQKEKNE